MALLKPVKSCKNLLKVFCGVAFDEMSESVPGFIPTDWNKN